MLYDMYKKYNVNVEKLSRDYKLKPLSIEKNGFIKHVEKPCKADIEYLYLVCNIPLRVLGDFFGVSITTIKEWNKDYNIKKDRKLIVKNIVSTNNEKYGVDNYTQTKEWHDKMMEMNGGVWFVQTNEFKELSYSTKLLRYGNPTYTNKEQQIQTTIDRYGVNNYSKTLEYIDKVKNTNRQRYGVDWCLQNTDVKNKCKETKLLRYGNPTYTNKEQFNQTMMTNYNTIHGKRIGKDLKKFEIIDNKQTFINYIISNNIKHVKDLSMSLGINISTLNNMINRYDIRYMFEYKGSVAEKEIRDYINNTYETINNSRKIISPYELDIYIPKLKKAIEYNGSYWHDYTIFPKKQERDKLKFNLCEEKGIELMVINENEYLNNKELIFHKIDGFIKNI